MKTNSNLHQLDVAPSHRGAAERINEKEVAGWCLLAAEPSRTISLRLYCEGLFIGSTQTALMRKEISEKVGQPVKAGFSFGWIECAPERRDALVLALQAGAQEAPLALRIEIDDAPEDALELDTAYAYSQGVPSRGMLLGQLRRLQSRGTRSTAAERDLILSRLPPPTPPERARRIDAVAFYLPQFHPVSENDDWWGPGFTEWNNVVAAQPLFDGHDQPRRPTELGYYDLRTPGVMERQIELARSHGLRGFCFHHYWFSGRKLLQQPIQQFLSLDHDFGFCLCWANEPWSRRWDGADQEVLIDQQHGFDSDVAFIHDAIPLMRDPRYLRADGMPLLLIHHVSLLTDAPRVIDRWRRIALEQGLPGLHVCMVESADLGNPQDYGCDSAVEFPPHKLEMGDRADALVQGLVPDFSGKLWDYGEVVAQKLALPPPNYRRYDTLMLGWDNTARRGPRAQVVHGYDPGLFELWLEHAAQKAQALSPGERYVFINAWNEWGEGSYLEPDQHWGRANLEVVRNVVSGQARVETRLALLRRMLDGQAEAEHQLDALRGQIEALQRSLGFALETARRAVPQLLPSLIGNRVPPGLERLQAGGKGGIERLGGHAASGGYCLLRKGAWLQGSGWALPGDGRNIDESTPLFMRLRPLDTVAPDFWAFIPTRVRREDVVKSSGLPESASLWSGFTLSADSSGLPAGRYELSLCLAAEQDEAGIELPVRVTLDLLP